MKPLIKYTGGKYNEYKCVKEYLPIKIDNYYEPFFGGGGMFFQLHNNNLICGKSFINDVSTTLMEFYKAINSKELFEELKMISLKWEELKEFADDFGRKYSNTFIKCIEMNDISEMTNEDVSKFVFDGIKQMDFNSHKFSLYDIVMKSIESKVRRFINKKNIKGALTEIGYKSLSTSVCQGFYFVVRDMYNDWNVYGNRREYGYYERIAHFLFIREFCFGGMHRFNKDGAFNIPYGGFSYNNKCFECKIEKIKSDEVQKIFRKCVFDNDDFQNVLTKYKFGNDDFIFLDPPYDSTFSEYDGNEFTHEDHVRLKETLSKIKCKWMVVIGKTDFIQQLYNDYNIYEYSKTYAYQAKGTYDNKRTKHLIITNY